MTQKELIDKYPKIFVPYEGNPYDVNWYIPNGWIQLVDDLCGAIQNHVDHWKMWDKDGVHTCPQVTCVQVKEKFGGLRFYTRGGNEKTEGMIDMAEYMSFRMCINCSTRENIVNTEGWISYKCKSCAEKDGDIWEEE